MITYFGGKVIRDAKAHAIAEYPKESCGIVVDNSYHRCNNIAENPEANFKIATRTYNKHANTGKIQCIIHSHDNFAMASYEDMVGQISSAVPWGIINLVGGRPQELLFWGDQLPTQDYYGRPFHSGIYDCFSLSRDILREEYNTILPNVAREHDFWSDPKGASHFEEQLAWMIPDELQIVDKNGGLKEGDGLLFKLAGSKVINHCGVYIGNGLIAHHLERKLSRREPVSNWFKNIFIVVRPTKVGK